MKRMLLPILLATVVFCVHAQRTVSGKVVSADDGGGIPGVNILIKGTITGTITDGDGNYRLSVPESGGTLVFSFVGLATQEIEIGSQSVIDVEMTTNISTLSEIVVTAVGIERDKKALGYSVESVSSDQIQQKSEPDVLKALQAKVPGVQIAASTGAPGSATRITIRGSSSFFGNNQPLFVVDGIPYNDLQYTTNNQLTGGGSYANGLAQLDPNNIESINVLKGAAAATLYGSRAANGVVVVTTKSGSARASQKGLEVTVSNSFAIEEIANLPDYQNSYGNGAHFLYSNANGSWGPAFASLDSFPTWPNYTAAYPDLGTWSPFVAQPNNVENLFRTGKVWDNSVSIVGGNERATLSTTISHMNQEGYIPFSDFERTSIGVGGRAELDNNFNVGGNINIARTNQNGPIFGAAAADPTAASSFARTLWLGRTWDTSLPFETPTGGNVFFNTLAIDHPEWSWKNNGLEAEVTRVNANMFVGYDVLDWINVTYKFGINTFTDRRQQVWNIGSNAFSGVGAVMDDDIFFEELESNLIITFRRNLTEDIDLTALVGQNINQRTTDRQSALGTTIISPGIFDIDNVLTLVPNGGTFQKRRLMGFFGEVNLGYRDFLYVNVTGRNDISSTLPENNRSFFYSSYSTSFIFTEAFNMSSNILSLGKVRASWAKVGNDAPVYSLSNTFAVNQGNSTGVIGSINQNDLPFRGQAGISQANRAADPDLTPEFTTEIEFGALLSFFNGFAELDMTYYKRNSTDQIATITLPSASGFEQLRTNFGDLENRGWEIGLNLNPINQSGGINWNIYAAYTRNRSEVLKLTNNIERINIRNLFGGSITPVLEVGQPYGAFFGTVAARDEEGNFLVDPRTGVLFPSLENDGFGIIGDPNPNYILGITNSVSWRGITLEAILDYKDGGDIYSVTVERLLGRGVTKDTEDREKSRIVDGFYGDPNTGLPLLDESGNKIRNVTQIPTNDLYFANGGSVTSFGINGQDEMSVYDGTVIRLREVSLAYQLPDAWLDGTPIGSARVSLTGRNLWFNAPNIPKHTNFDPEVNGFGSTNTQGIEYSSAPQSKRYGVNLKFTF